MICPFPTFLKNKEKVFLKLIAKDIFYYSIVDIRFTNSLSTMGYNLYPTVELIYYGISYKRLSTVGYKLYTNTFLQIRNNVPLNAGKFENFENSEQRILPEYTNA